MDPASLEMDPSWPGTMGEDASVAVEREGTDQLYVVAAEREGPDLIYGVAVEQVGMDQPWVSPGVEEVQELL